MIKEEYVSFEIAKLLKDKGFNKPLFTFYVTDKDKKESTFQIMAFTDDTIDNNRSEFCYLAPTQQMAMRWLREKHLLHISLDMMNGGTWMYEISDISIPFDGGIISKAYEENCKSYEKAVEEAIKYCLEYLI